MLPLRVMLPLLPETVAAPDRVRLLDQTAVLVLLLAPLEEPAPLALMLLSILQPLLLPIPLWLVVVRRKSSCTASY
jgi:hypothetical protein